MALPDRQPDPLPRQPGRVPVVRLRGPTVNPWLSRRAAYGALYEQLTGRDGQEVAGDHPLIDQALGHPREPERVDWQTGPQELVRLTYPVAPCTCPLLPGEHVYTDACPPPAPSLVEVSEDGGRTWTPRSSPPVVPVQRP